VARADDRLRGTTQTVRERSRNIIRSLQGHDRTVSSFIEWAIERALSHVILAVDADEVVNLDLASAILWDPDEADRFAKLALYYPDLLTYEEEVLWKVIEECEALWRDDFNHRRGLPLREKVAMLRYPALRTHWETLNKVAAGEADPSILPQRPGAPPIPITPPSPPTDLAPTPVGDQRKP
jgi:hypothetical protein